MLQAVAMRPLSVCKGRIRQHPGLQAESPNRSGFNRLRIDRPRGVRHPGPTCFAEWRCHLGGQTGNRPGINNDSSHCK